MVSETITTSTKWESNVLAPAFSAITRSSEVTHTLIGRWATWSSGWQTQMQTGENVFDMYINDADLIGTHWRYQLGPEPDRVGWQATARRSQPQC